MTLHEAIKLSKAERALDGVTDKDSRPGARRELTKGKWVVSYEDDVLSYSLNDFQIVQANSKIPISRNAGLYIALEVGARDENGDFMSDQILGKEDWEPL